MTNYKSQIFITKQPEIDLREDDLKEKNKEERSLFIKEHKLNYDYLKKPLTILSFLKNINKKNEF